MPTENRFSVLVNSLKTRQRDQGMWQDTDDLSIDPRLRAVGESLAGAVGVETGQRVLDVAAGSGNFSLAALHRGAKVISTDYVLGALNAARTRISAEGLQGEFRLADAEALPFSDDSFDIVASTFGVMFTHRPEIAAAEILRTCRPGGRIGLTSWTPEGFVGEAYAIAQRYVPAPLGVPAPTLWGTPGYLDRLFSEGTHGFKSRLRTFDFRARSKTAWLSVARKQYGPLSAVFAALPTRLQRAFENDLLSLIDRFNPCLDGSVVLPAQYLEAQMQRDSPPKRAPSTNRKCDSKTAASDRL